MPTSPAPRRGEVWYVDLGEPVGHEQGYHRPALVVSRSDFNRGPGAIAVVVPLTTRQRNVLWQVPVSARETGLAVDSFARCQDVRSVSLRRVGRYVGQVSPDTFALVEDRLRTLLQL